MNTPDFPNSKRTPRSRGVTVAFACVMALATVGALNVAHSNAANDPTTTSIDRGLPNNADAADAWLASQAAASDPPCRPDAAQRWQIPQIAVADLPHSADAMDAWLTPEINIADLPRTADAMEHWLCAP
jgi:hypothetical protein